MLSSTTKTFFLLGISIASIITSSESKFFPAFAQSPQAVIYAPPSNVRATPNGQIICSIKAVTSINTYGYEKGWYLTDICGRDGYIHESQIRFEQSNYQSSPSSAKCLVTNIQTGQLAVRKSPGGKAIAGLNNNNVVQYLQGEMPWYYIRVLSGPNSQVNGKTGWVNANYLDCF